MQAKKIKMILKSCFNVSNTSSKLQRRMITYSLSFSNAHTILLPAFLDSICMLPPQMEKLKTSMILLVITS